MDTNLIRSWLGLPPGPWPPDDRTLLGLTDPAAPPAAAERQALAQMAKLRPHQLVHPDLVTEGMNRLAQALLAVSMAAPTVPAPPPPKLVPVAPKPTPAPPKPSSKPALPAIPPVAGPVRVPSAGNLEEIETVDDVDEDDESQERPRAGAAAPQQPAVPVDPSALAASAPDVDVPAARVGPRAVDRRSAYRELAGLRAVLRAWDQLRPFFADPSETAPTAGHVFDFLEAVAAFRAAARHPALERGLVADVAPRTAAVARQPLALAVFRSLTPSQRVSLARDWAAGRAWFEAYAVEVRVAVRRAAHARSPGGFASTKQFLAHNPEWMMAAAAAVLALVTLAKLIIRQGA